ncbi:hypothetical protein B0H13DRAFT_2497682 [Mycena leptocephala]|nr:hypothetical protein B0H13DRAFT_2497682 [Mycena leptocephala]
MRANQHLSKMDSVFPWENALLWKWFSGRLGPRGNNGAREWFAREPANVTLWKIESIYSCCKHKPAAQEGHDDLSACDLPHPYALLLNHSEHPRVQQQPVGEYFQHFHCPPLISLRVAILKNTCRDAAVSVLGRGTPVDPARMAAWGGKRRQEIQARDAGNGVLQRRRGTPTAITAIRSGLAGEEQPALAGRQMPGVGRSVDPVRRAAWSG